MKDTKNNETKIGIVIESLPNAMFRVDFSNGKDPSEENVKIAYLGGKMKFNRIRVLIGDKVEVLTEPYGGKGRIVKRI